MADNLAIHQRRYCMSRIRSVDTVPELFVRRLLHSLGFRYRLHARGLPGQPDLVFASRRKVIFVHGCFWHRHRCVRGKVMPKSNPHYWSKKLQLNRDRDSRNKNRLRREGWEVAIVWECQLADLDALKWRLVTFLNA